MPKSVRVPVLHSSFRALFFEPRMLMREKPPVTASKPVARMRASILMKEPSRIRTPSGRTSWTGFLLRLTRLTFSWLKTL